MKLNLHIYMKIAIAMLTGHVDAPNLSECSATLRGKLKIKLSQERFSEKFPEMKKISNGSHHSMSRGRNRQKL